jgi:hypothetical protein
MSHFSKVPMRERGGGTCREVISEYFEVRKYQEIRFIGAVRKCTFIGNGESNEFWECLGERGEGLDMTFWSPYC